VVTEEIAWRRRIERILSERKRSVIRRKGLKPSAVLVPIYKKGAEFYIVLTKRSEDVEYHKGQVSFPGGAYEEGDRDLKETALRESFEETGIHAEDVEVLGNLDDQATLSSNFAITPFVGAIKYPYEFNVNRREVEELIEAPVTLLLDPTNFSDQTPDAKGTLHPWGYYRCGRNNITGITARILKQLLDLTFS
jgi:8-oxo-dGTP pyrophosphatase MutT (NUDIX family)